MSPLARRLVRCKVGAGGASLLPARRLHRRELTVNETTRSDGERNTSEIKTSAEIYRPIPGYEGIYSVSDRGSVRRDVKSSDGSGITKPGFILRPVIDHYGYPVVVLSWRNKKKMFKVHNLVALAFMGERPNGHVVDHLNGVKSDSRLENLEFVTPIENTRRAKEMGLIARGELAGPARLTTEQVVSIRRERSEGLSANKLAAKYGVCRRAINKIVDRSNWRHVA